MKAGGRKGPSGRWTDWTAAAFFGLAALALMAFLIRQAQLSIQSSPAVFKTKYHEVFPGSEEAASLSAEKNQWVVRAANREQCPCKCGYTLAACLKTDSACPIRSKNLARVRELILAARSQSP